MKKIAIVLAIMLSSCLPLHSQAAFPQFGSIENDGLASLNRFNLGWTNSITLVSLPSRGLTFNPRLTYNSFVWQKNGTVWSPVAGEDGNPTWGWIKDGSSFLGGPLTYNVMRYRCVANDGTNQWAYEYNNFKTPGQTFNIDVTLAEQPDLYPECSGTGQTMSSYGHDTSGAPTGYLLVLQGNGGPMPWPFTINSSYQNANNNTRPVIFAPGGIQADMSGSLVDTNGNKAVSNINGNVETWTDSIGRTSLTITNDTTNQLTTYSYPDTGGVTQTWTMNYTLRNIATAFGCANMSEYVQSSIYLPTSLSLPGSNGSYSFEYESTPGSTYPGYTTGRISKITLPTGGWISYTYSGVNCDDGSPMQLTKTINDGSTSHSWTYTRTNNGDGTWKTVENTPSNAIEIAFSSYGVPTDEKTYAGAVGGSVLQEVQTGYSGDNTPGYVTTINGSKSKTTNYNYDGFGNLIGKWEFDWNSTTTYLRTTFNQFVTDPAYLNAGLVNLLSSQTVRQGDATGPVQSKTQWFYDAKNPDGTPDNDSGNIAMTCQSGAAAHDDINYGCTSTTPRGNLTKVVHYADAASSAGAIKTYYGYDSLGNLVQVKDPRGNSTSLSYADNWDGTSACSVSSAFAYPTSMTNALGHNQTNWFNRCTGQMVKTQDANHQLTTYAYNDPLLRLKNVGYPDGGGFNYSYTSTQTTALTIGGTSTTATIDSLGRTTHFQTPDGTVDYSYGYDGQGATLSVSNPHQGGSATSTTTHYDSLGRPTGVDYADGTSHSSSTYSDNCTTVTDAASRSRKLCTDALGRIAQVYEDPSGANYLTSYTYSSLNNLTDILQNGVMPRHFLYDSLSRMIAANNPENSTPQQPASQSCGTSQSWTACYGYDNNGNLTSRTDNRGVSVSNSYDALNRLTSTIYSDGITPNNYYTYDVAPGWMSDLQNVIGRLANSANQFGGGTSGRSIAATYSYDPMGRVIREWKQTPSASPGGFFVYSGYDLAGNLTSLTYPDGRKVTQSFDTSGHLSAVTYDSWNGQHVGYSYASGFSYAPSGAMTNMTLGNGVQTGILYNSRQQVCQMTTSFPASYGSTTQQVAIDKHYYYASNAGFCAATTGNNGNIAIITDERNPGKTQGFGYDSLNRLTSASRSDGGFNYSYPIDPFGNMTQVNNLTGNPTVSFPNNNQMQVGGNAYTYDAAGNLVDTGQYGQHFTYDAEGRIYQVNQGSTASYTYNLQGQRARKDANGSWTEYFYFGSRTLVELHSDGTWSDYIYANGQRIARAESSEARIHLAGNNCSNCGAQYTLFGMPLPNYTIQSGDLLFATQYSAGSRGGLQIQLSAPNTWLTVNDQDGNNIMDDTMQNQWHHRSFPLPSTFVGMSFANVGLTVNSRTPAGSWNMYFRDIGIVQANGTVIPLYKSGTTLTLSATPTSGVTQVSGTTETGSPLGSQVEETVYYVADHLNTAQMEFASGGWPVWKGEFAPYGQEINPQQTANNYKFTGLERDNESGLDHATFRQYSSTMGRWMSPDPYLGSMDLTNPQSFNRYAYVRNNPLRFTDTSGLNEDGDDPCDIFTCFEGGGGGGAGGGDDGGGGGGGRQCIANCDGGTPPPDDPAPPNDPSPGSTINLLDLMPIGPSSSVYSEPGGAGGGNGAPTNATPKTCVQKALLATVPGLQDVGPTEGAPSPYNNYGHMNETDTLTFSSPAAMAQFRGTTRIGLVPSSVSELGFGPGLRLPGGLHAEFFGMPNGQLAVTSHIDLFNPNDGLGPLLGHFFVDVLYGHIRGRNYGGLDKGC